MSARQFEKLIKNINGISMVEVLIALAMAGGLALVVAKLSSNQADVSVRANSAMEELELVNDVKLILGDSRYCKISLENAAFKKMNVDGVDGAGKPNNEGKDVELWLSDTGGSARTTKKYNGANNPGSNDKSQYGKLVIRSMKLVMNNNTGTNYSDSLNFSDIGELRITIAKKSSAKTTTEKELAPIKLRVQMKSAGGNSTILSCSQSTPADNKTIDVWASDITSGNNGFGEIYSTFKCPNGYAISAVDARTGNDWDSIQFQCRDLVGNYSNQSMSARFGGAGGGGQGVNSSSCKCPGQGFISAIYMYTGSETDGLRGDCVNKSFVGVGGFGHCGGGSGGGAKSGKSQCPPNSVATGAYVKYHWDRIHYVKLLCTQKVETVSW